jgi:hypothetical protein
MGNVISEITQVQKSNGLTVVVFKVILNQNLASLYHLELPFLSEKDHGLRRDLL